MNFSTQTIFRSIIFFASVIVLNSQCKNVNSKDAQSSDAASIDTSQVYQVSSVAPRYPGCEALATNEEKKSCSDKKLLEYLYAHIQYPEYAKDHGVQGRCVISFIIEKNGSLSNIKIVKDIGGGCGEAALAVVDSMNAQRDRWIPGVDHDQIVRVQYYLPVNFRLEEKVEKKE